MARRLEHIYTLVAKTSHLARFIIFGSFVTHKPDPGDIDIFLLMEGIYSAVERMKSRKLRKKGS
jgi:predicted nucleotidyltransferase